LKIGQNQTEIGGWQPVGVIKDAIQSLIRALQGLVTVLLWLALFILPILLVIILPLYLIVRAMINWRRRRKSKPLAESTEPPQEPAQED
jgi:uncharacterized membrane protein